MRPCCVFVESKAVLKLWKLVVVLVQIGPYVLLVLSAEVYSRIAAADADLFNQLRCTAHSVIWTGENFTAVAAHHLNVASVAMALREYFFTRLGIPCRKWGGLCGATYQQG